MNKTHRVKVLGLLGLPLLALALAVMVFSWGSSTDTTEAAVEGNDMTIAVSSGEVTCPVIKTGGETCVGLGAKFEVEVSASAVPIAASTTGNGYIGAQAWLQFGATGLVCKSIGMTWPDGSIDALVGGCSPDHGFAGAATGPLANPVPSTHKGGLFTFSINCTAGQSEHTITLEPFGGPNAGANGSGYTDGVSDFSIKGSPSILLNCVPGPTPTPTSTPPPIPKMSKLPALQNVFLTRQGSKIPPTDCLSGNDIGGLSETLSQGIVSFPPLPKPQVFQQLGAFEFEVHFDATKVCVDLTEGAAWSAVGAICFVSPAEGVARIGCVTQGKSDIDPEDINFHEAIDALAPLAQIDVYPQPDVYSQAKPNQDNGVVVQINNVGCDLGDEQGHAISVFSCDDADITFRYLEGDVSPDCVIDAADAQSIAFRWGVEKGSVLYKDFMNLEPSNQKADNDIDINDLQFVYGRFGSNCDPELGGPHPPQPPVNPKA